MNDRLLKKLILETIQEVLSEEDSGHEVGADKEFLGNFKQCEDYGDIYLVREAWKEAAKKAIRKTGVTIDLPQSKLIDEYASHFPEAFSKHFAENSSKASQGYRGHQGLAREKDSPAYHWIQEIEHKALSLFHKVKRAINQG